MPRYIIECEDPTDIILGMRVIKGLMESEYPDCIVSFEDNSLWYVKKTKTGYSARTTARKKDE